jgi:hypothetical protein
MGYITPADKLKIDTSTNTFTCKAQGGTHNLLSYQTKNHTHSTPNHTHSTPNHTHTTPDHTHNTPDHTHDLGFGIYEEANSPTINIYIDNGSGYGSSIGAYTTDQTDIDITSHISGSGWKEIRFTSTARCRISCIVEIKLDIRA